MNWENIAGHQILKKQLLKSISENRVSHAQLFLGEEGFGTLPLALAYAKEILRLENATAASKVEHLNHLDLHFSFPVFTENKNSLSKRLFNEFRDMVLQNPYFSLEDWTSTLESQNKQFFISADEIDELNQKFALKSFEGGTKILIIWRADKLNISAANKLLKFLEEPPEKTVILLTANNLDDILPTILSRTQIIDVPRIEQNEIEEFLQKNFEFSSEKILEAVAKSQGNLNEAVKILTSEEEFSEFDTFFIQWVRDAFQVKKKPEFLKNIINWARNIATWNREKQKSFLDYCTEMFRLALLQNYGNSEMVYKKIDSGGFNWDSFSKFVNGANIEEILEQISEADYHLTRNANPKIVWTDLGIKLSRYIHKKV